MTERLPGDRLAQVHDAVLELLGYDPATRAALLTGLPIKLRGLLPGGTAAPAIGLTLDLDRLNGIDRLVDGTVPLKQFLAKAVGFVDQVEAADVLRVALSEVEATANGVALPASGTAPTIEEAVVGRDDMLPHGFMPAGVQAARAVAKLAVPRHRDGRPVLVNGEPRIHLGTGWLIGRDLLATNHHVVNARELGEAPATEQDLRAQAAAMSVQFDFDTTELVGKSFQPATVGDLVAWDARLDYALVRLPDCGRDPLPLAAAPLEVAGPDPAIALNIIQHPDGRPKQFAIRNNLVVDVTDDVVRYFTDTMGGSSGSPVFDDRWEVVALHRGATPVHGVQYLGRRVAYVNVGTTIRAITAHLLASAHPVDLG